MRHLPEEMLPLVVAGPNICNCVWLGSESLLAFLRKLLQMEVGED